MSPDGVNATATGERAAAPAKSLPLPWTALLAPLAGILPSTPAARWSGDDGADILFDTPVTNLSMVYTNNFDAGFSPGVVDTGVWASSGAARGSGDVSVNLLDGQPLIT